MSNAPGEELQVSIELTDQQQKLIREREGGPVEVVDPQTQRSYVLIAREQYEKVRELIPSPTGPDAASGVPQGIRRSQEAFWRDLPQLLAQKQLIGQWVCYHGDERVGIGRYEDLIRECLRRGIRDDEYDLAIIEPEESPPWEPEEVEPLGPQHLEE